MFRLTLTLKTTMTHRRNFLKSAALFGAAVTLPVHNLFAQSAESGVKPVGDGLSEVSYGQELSRKKTPRQITIPDVEGYKVLKGDFHIHSVFSDGIVMPQERVLEAVDNGLDAIAITDHIEYRPHFGTSHSSYGGRSKIKLLDKNDDHNIAYDLAKPEADKNKLILVRGTEITRRTLPPGDINAIFLEDVNPVAAAADDWKTMLAVAADQGGFVFWNHPGWIAPGNGGMQPGETMRFTDEHDVAYKKGHLHGVEVFNGVNYYPIVSQWCAERNLAMLANSDVHATEWNTYGHQNTLRPVTLVLAKERTHDSLREAFFARRTIAWAANLIVGKQPWVEKLFRACVEVKKTGTGLSLQNLSDIPCVIEASGKSSKLSAKGSLEIAASPKLTVSNWFVGMGKPLEVVVA